MFELIFLLGNLRVVKRAKRSNKSNSFSEDNGQQAAGVIPAPGSFRALNKNSRRPRHQAGRGLPKKNGGGGKVRTFSIESAN